MTENKHRDIERLLTSAQPDEVRRGLALARGEIARLGDEAASPLFEMVSTLFYLDPLDRPDLVPVLDEAINLVAGLGTWVIPILIQSLEAGDVKAQMAIAQVLGRMGAAAIDPLMAEMESCPDIACRTFLLYALGHVRSPEVVRAVPIALEAASSTDQELRDTATRALGKFAAAIPPSAFPDELRAAAVEVLKDSLADPNAAIRSKAVRSLGKLARHGHLTDEERAWLAATLKHLLGEDEHYDWDRAYVVRREASEALQYA